MPELTEILSGAKALAGHLPPLLLAAIAAFLVTTLGGLVRRPLPLVSGLLRFSGNAALLGVVVLAGVRFARLEPSLDAPLGSLGLPAQRVEGTETRVPMAADGHFWITAKVNGTRQRFMVDTGATVSAIASDAAAQSGIAPDKLRLPVVVRTANGPTEAQMGHIASLRFGSIAARDLDVVITANTGGLNLLGMNFLSRLKGWRVEDGVLILSPRHPQSPEAA